jgi:hypothetical protein
MSGHLPCHGEGPDFLPAVISAGFDKGFGFILCRTIHIMQQRQPGLISVLRVWLDASNTYE